MQPLPHAEDGTPSRTWCGKADQHEAHRWFAAEHRLTPMRCRGSLGAPAKPRPRFAMIGNWPDETQHWSAARHE